MTTTVEDKVRRAVVSAGENVAREPGIIARKEQLVPNGEDLRESCISLVASRVVSSMAGLGLSIRAGMLGPVFKPSEGLDTAGERISRRFPNGTNVLSFTPDDACWSVNQVCVGWAREESGEGFDVISELVVDRILPIELKAIEKDLVGRLGAPAPSPPDADAGGGCLIAMTTFAGSVAIIAASATKLVRRTRRD